MLMKNKFIQGYTLIETMIALSIFLTVVVVGIGALLNASSVSQKSQNTRSILDSISYSMEDMSRNIRTGYSYHCLIDPGNIASIGAPKSCYGSSGGGGYGIAFESGVGDTTTNDQWIYFVSNGKLYRSTTGNFDNAVQMTPDEVVISEDNYNFLVFGAEEGDGQQPFVIIRLVGKIMYKGEEIPFSLQTSVSQRKNDI